MNTVKLLGDEPIPETTVGAIKEYKDHDGNHRTAFIGACGDGPKHELYFIGYDMVVLAEHPRSWWLGLNCPITVDRFVDVEITVK